MLHQPCLVLFFTCQGGIVFCRRSSVLENGSREHPQNGTDSILPDANGASELQAKAEAPAAGAVGGLQDEILAQGPEVAELHKRIAAVFREWLAGEKAAAAEEERLRKQYEADNVSPLTSANALVSSPHKQYQALQDRRLCISFEVQLFTSSRTSAFVLGFASCRLNTAEDCPLEYVLFSFVATIKNPKWKVDN